MVNTKTLRPEQVESAVRACLAEVPFLRLEGLVRDRGASQGKRDFGIKARTARGSRQIVVKSKTSGEPRLAREAIAAMRSYAGGQSKAYAVLVAPYISPRTADLCRAENIGYVDLSGNCRLCFDDIYIERQGQPNKFARKRDLRKLYSPKASRVLRVLLNAPRKAWAVNALAREAQVSIGLAWKVKELLADREWASTEKNGVVLKQAEDLLAEWARNYSYRQNAARDYYSMQKPAQLERAMAEACARRNARYALTAFSAAERMAPMVRYQRVFAYVADGIEKLARELGLKEVPSGANVTILEPYDDGVFYGARAFDSVQTVSPVQAYLDLFSNKGRGEEAAETLLREIIRPQW